MDLNHIENVYYTLIGQLQEEYCVPGVENLFTEDSECEQAYEQIFDAYARLRDRLGVPDEDPDVEVIINSLLKTQRLIAIKMYEYGRNMTK